MVTGITALSTGQLAQLIELLSALERALEADLGARDERGLPSERHSELLAEIRDLSDVVRRRRVC